MRPEVEDGERISQDRSGMKSSLTYQLLLYLGSWYCAAFLAAEFFLFIYKILILPYQTLTIVSEVNFGVKTKSGFNLFI